MHRCIAAKGSCGAFTRQGTASPRIRHLAPPTLAKLGRLGIDCAPDLASSHTGLTAIFPHVRGGPPRLTRPKGSGRIGYLLPDLDRVLRYLLSLLLTTSGIPLASTSTPPILDAYRHPLPISKRSVTTLRIFRHPSLRFANQPQIRDCFASL
jgi:hypothetical protein